MYANAKAQVRRIVLFRSILIFALIAVVQFAVSTTLFAGIILISLGFAYAVYYILTLSLSMELIPAGKTGVFDVLVSLGAAAGSFLGPLIAETFGFLPQFLAAAGVFFFAYAVLRILS
jgi:MFS family permease